MTLSQSTRPLAEQLEQEFQEVRSELEGWIIQNMFSSELLVEAPVEELSFQLVAECLGILRKEVEWIDDPRHAPSQTRLTAVYDCETLAKLFLNGNVNLIDWRRFTGVIAAKEKSPGSRTSLQEVGTWIEQYPFKHPQSSSEIVLDECRRLGLSKQSLYNIFWLFYRHTERDLIEAANMSVDVSTARPEMDATMWSRVESFMKRLSRWAYYEMFGCDEAQLLPAALSRKRRLLNIQPWGPTERKINVTATMSRARVAAHLAKPSTLLGHLSLSSTRLASYVGT